ncbi:MAG: hypothetical protein ACREDZ_14540 [Kiloniellales bacterium]
MVYNDSTRRWSRRRRTRATSAVAALLVLFVLTPLEAQAYVGPGAGITALGWLVALVAGLFFAVIGFVWYPIKRLRRRRKQRQRQEVSKT